MTASFDPLSAESIADPYPFLASLRQEAPVSYCPAIDMWVVTRHADVDHVFSHPELFSAANAQTPLLPLCDEAMAILKAGFRILPVMSNADRPGHTRFRRPLARGFSARRMRVLTPVIEARCGAILDDIAGAGGGDLMQALCYPLPALTIFTMIGFPDTDADRIKAWCADKLVVNWGRPTAGAQVRAARTMVAFWDYCEAFVADRRRAPADDLTSDLLQDDDVDPPLTDQEIASIVFGLSFAGHETTTNLAANCIRQVLLHGLWPKLRAGRDSIPDVIEETLRYDSSVTAWRRIAKEDCVIGGAAVPAGAKLMLSLAAANRDPTVFAAPDSFDPSRANSGAHLSFGKGLHYCLGVPLARIEVAAVLNGMLDRFATVDLAEPDAPEFPPNIAFRGPLRLPVRWTLAEAG